MGRNKVKPEQASKVLMRMPALQSFGEGRTRGEVIDKRTHAIRRGSGYGTSVGWFVVTGGDPSRTRVKTRIGDLLVPSNIDPWPEVRDKLNRSLRGWSNYFGYGSRGKAYRSVDQYVIERVRSFLARRHKVQGRGNRRFTFDVIHRELGVLCLQRLPRAVPSCALR